MGTAAQPFDVDNESEPSEPDEDAFEDMDDVIANMPDPTQHSDKRPRTGESSRGLGDEWIEEDDL